MRSAVRVTGGAETIVWVAESKLELLFRMGQRVMRDQRGHVRQLSGFGAEKFAPRRSVEEQIGDRNRGPARQGRIFDAQNFAAGNLNVRARRSLRRSPCRA